MPRRMRWRGAPPSKEEIAEYQGPAEELVRRTAQRGFSYSGELPLGKTWAFVYEKDRDSELVEISNFDVMLERLERYYSDADLQVVRFRDWAVGWVDHIAVRMLDKIDRVTQAGISAIRMLHSLEKYGLLDEMAYSILEAGTGHEHIQMVVNVTLNEAIRISRWLWEHNPDSMESVYGHGPAPSDESIQEAAIALGILGANDA